MQKIMRTRTLALMLSCSCLVLTVVACSEQTSATAEAAPTASRSAPTKAAGLPAPTALPPAALAAWQADARAYCRDIGEKFVGARFVPLASDDASAELSEAGQGAFLAGDFNGDGRPDFLAITPSGGCSFEGAPYGRAGPPNSFLLSTASGYQVNEGFMGYISTGMIKRRGDRDVLDYRGSFNGTCGFIEYIVWGHAGGKMDVIERRNDKGALVDREGCAVAAKPSSPTGNFPPIPKGFYAAGMSCAAAIDERAISDRSYPGDNLGIFDDKTWGFFFEDSMPWGNKEYKGFEQSGTNRYRIKVQAFGNGDGPGTPETLTINVTGPGRFSETYMGQTRTYTHCPDSSVPAALRQHFENG